MAELENTSIQFSTVERTTSVIYSVERQETESSHDHATDCIAVALAHLTALSNARRLKYLP